MDKRFWSKQPSLPVVGDAKDSDEFNLADFDKKVEKLFHSQELLFERLHSEPKHRRFYTEAKHAAKRSAQHISRQPMVVKVAAIGLALVGIYGAYSLIDRPASVSEVAGVTTNQATITRETPRFPLVVPAGKSIDSLEPALISPNGSAPTYAFTDRIGDVTVIVSQQELPASLKSDTSNGLSALAKDFQATETLQIDNLTVYIGLNDKTKVQSVIFVKKDRLIFIRGEQTLDRNMLAGYVASLN